MSSRGPRGRYSADAPPARRPGAAWVRAAALVLEDATAAQLSPVGCAGGAITLYRRQAADTLVAEVNQGAARWCAR